MLNRTFENTLLKWKNSTDKKALLIKGARQVGKTFTVREFGSKYYKSFIEINLYKDQIAREIFDSSLDMDTLKKRITSHIRNAKFINGDTLIFIDEIEFSPNARTALKFITEDKRYDCIATGSLLSISYKDVLSIPVGYEEQIEMYSLDFEEYLIARGFGDVIDIAKDAFNNKIKIDDTVNNNIINLLREYIVVGGMPEVVSCFIDSFDYNEVYRVQKRILKSFEDDIIKYAETREKPKVKNSFLSIPNQLARENKKFMFSKIESKATKPKYENSIEWLRDANLITPCYNMTSPKFPIMAYRKLEQYKIYLFDVGLLTCMYGKEIRETILNNTLKGDIKGGIYENLIACFLTRKNEKLLYYKNDANSQEIEFFIERDGSIIPIEVKSGNNRTISLNEILKDDDIKLAYKFVDGNIGIDGKKITLPHYMAMFI